MRSGKTCVSAPVVKFCSDHGLHSLAAAPLLSRNRIRSL